MGSLVGEGSGGGGKEQDAGSPGGSLHFPGRQCWNRVPGKVHAAGCGKGPRRHLGGKILPYQDIPPHHGVWGEAQGREQQYFVA